MNNEMLERCEVKKLVLNENQSEVEQRELIEWHYQRMDEDREAFLNALLSLDVEEVQATLLDVLRLAGVDHGQADIDAALDGQALDLCGYDDRYRDDLNLSMD